ncbi:MAG TPA: Clp protease N-terminal domain-containing protein [Micromonosporaceae bacterium]|jgi:ATP-dependent Clp protease ATP-binding subunit ClpA
MTASFPVPLDNLIAYVKALQPHGNPLDELAQAVAVTERLDEQGDALIGHFVDQARRSGASWSQIGASMGVSKQAAQKRFVPRWDGSDPVPESRLFSRFTDRARNVLAKAQAMAGSAEVSSAAIVVGLLSEPEGLAAKIIHQLGVTDQALCAALRLDLVEARGDADPGALRRIAFAEDAKKLLTGTLKAVLRLGHNYVGTEHLLLGALFAGQGTAAPLNELGITVDNVEAGIASEVARIKAERQAPRAR